MITRVPAQDSEGMRVHTGRYTSEVEQAYRETLDRLGTVVDFDISALDRLGVPVTSCSLAVEGRFLQHGNGYGATDEAAAISGLGELAEGVVSERTLRSLPVRTATRSELIGELGAENVVDPRLLCLPAGCDFTDDQRLSWVPVRRLRDEATVQLPLEFVANDPGEHEARAGDGARSLIVPITNGLGAGLDPTRAITHGIGEIVQRHTNGLRFRALDARSPVIDPDGLPDSVSRLLQRFADVGVQVSLKHAGTAFGMFSCYAVGRDEDLSDPIRLTACGEAAHPSPEVSMQKAVLEYANSRARKAFCFGSDPRIEATAPAAYWEALTPTDGEPRARQAMQQWADLPAAELQLLTAADLSRQVSSAEIAGTGSTMEHSDLGWYLEQFSGHDVLTSIGQIDEVRTAKTVITGMEVETLSYGRIGEVGVETSIENDLGLVRVGPSPSGTHTHRISLTAEAEERLDGPCWFSYHRAAEIVGPLYPLYREPPRHSVRVGSVRVGSVRVGSVQATSGARR